MNEIQEIFNEYYSISVKVLLNTYPYSPNTIICDTPDYTSEHFVSLSEVFIEWYLYMPSTNKNLPRFLRKAKINHMFTTSDFIDLMSGKAYLDDEIIETIAQKIPYHITANKLAALNTNAKTYTAHKISGNSGEKPTSPRSQKLKEKLHDYYLKHKEIFNARSKKWNREHQDQIKEINKKWREQHPGYDQQRDKTKRREAEKLYRQTHHDTIARKQHDNYQRKRAERLEYQMDRYYKFKERAANASKICTAYVFLMELKKKNPSKYLELYTKHQDPLNHMVKTCTALQTMDINQCPFCNHKCGHNPTQCCNQKVLSIPNTIDTLHNIANNLKQR